MGTNCHVVVEMRCGGAFDQEEFGSLDVAWDRYDLAVKSGRWTTIRLIDKVDGKVLRRWPQRPKLFVP